MQNQQDEELQHQYQQVYQHKRVQPNNNRSQNLNNIHSHQANVTYYFARAYTLVIDLYFFVPTCSVAFQIAFFIVGLYLGTGFGRTVYETESTCPTKSVQGIALAMCSLIFVHFMCGIVDLILRCFSFWNDIRTPSKHQEQLPQTIDNNSVTPLFRKMLNAFFVVRILQYLLETVVELFVTVYITIIVVHTPCYQEHPLFYKSLLAYCIIGWISVGGGR